MEVAAPLMFKDLPAELQALVNAAVSVAAYCPAADVADVGADWPVSFARARELRTALERFIARG